MGACTEIDASTCIRSYELHEPRNIPHLANFIYPRLHRIIFARSFTFNDRSESCRYESRVTYTVSNAFVSNDDNDDVSGLRNPDTARTKNRARTAAAAKPKGCRWRDSKGGGA